MYTANEEDSPLLERTSFLIKHCRRYGFMERQSNIWHVNACYTVSHQPIADSPTTRQLRISTERIA